MSPEYDSSLTKTFTPSNYRNSAMQSPEDPWDWSVNDVSRELVQATDNYTVGQLARLHHIDGKCLLTSLTLRNLKDEIGIVPFGIRVTIMRTVEMWRGNSRQYSEHRYCQDNQRKRDTLRDLVQQHELEREFRQITGSTLRRRSRSRSLSPLPDLDL